MLQAIIGLELALAAAAWLGAVFSPLDFIAQFGLLMATAAAVVWLAASLNLRTQRRTWIAALVAFLLWGGLNVPDILAAWTQPRAEPGGVELKIVQLNVLASDQHNAVKLAWLKAENPDIIVLQEVAPAAQPLLAALAERYPYKMTCENRPYPCEVVILARRMAVRDGFFRGDAKMPNNAWAQFEGPGGPYTVMGVHISRVDGGQIKLIRNFAKAMAGIQTDRLIVAGDFNATPTSHALRTFDRASGSLIRRSNFKPTYPARSDETPAFMPPVLALDHIYAGPAWRTVRLERGPSVGSDHRPLVATLRLN